MKKQPIYQIKHTKGWSDLRPEEVELYKNSNATVRLKPSAKLIKEPAM